MNTLADTILDELRNAESAEQIHSIADDRRSEVFDMKATDPARYWHIVNMKKYMLRGLEQ